MNTVVIGYYPSLDLLNAAIWEHIKHYKNVQKGARVRFEPYYQPVWHRGHIAYEQLKFKVVVTYQTVDGKMQTRRCSSQGWSVYAISREGKQVRVIGWEGPLNNLGREYSLESGEEGKTCTCEAFQQQGRLTGGKCEHLGVATPELDRTPWLEYPIYSYPAPYKIPHRPQPQPEELRNPDPTPVNFVQLTPGLVPTPGFELISQAGGGDRYPILARLRSHQGHSHTAVLGTVIQDGEWMTFTDTRGSYGRAVTATETNLRLICQDLLLRSRYKDWTLIATYPPQEVKGPQALTRKKDSTANPPQTEPRCRIRVEKDLKTGLYSLYNLETKSFVVQACPKSEVSQRAKLLVDSGHLVNAVDRTTGNWYNFQDGNWHYVGTKEISKIAQV